MYSLGAEFGILVVSIAGLVYFADMLIDSAAKLAKAIGVSGTVIGLTLLAYGTSLPEFTVSALASFGGLDSMSIGNIVGSNLYNIAVVIGIAALFRNVKPESKRDAREDGAFMMFCSLLLLLLLYLGGIGRLTGAFMAAMVVGYSAYVIRRGREGKKIRKNRSISKLKETAIVVFALLFVVVSGKYCVGSAANVARLAGLSEWFIGATIVALGTSLPEIVVSIMAAHKRQYGMSLGNIIGSNIFNIMWVLGIAAVISPLTLSLAAVSMEMLFFLVVTAFFFGGLWKGKITKLQGLLYIMLFIGFMGYLVLSQPMFA